MKDFMKHNVIPLFLIILISCCSGNESFIVQEIGDLDDTLSVSKTHILSPKNSPLSPLYILNANDQYLIISEQAKNDFLKVYSIPEFDTSFMWGKQGRGPNEFITFPTELGVFKDSVYLFEAISQNVRLFTVTDSNLIYSRSEHLSYEGQTTPLNRIRRINSGLYFADFGTEEVRSSDKGSHEHIALEPSKDSPLFTFGTYPKTKLQGFDRYGTYFKTNSSKPDGSSFVTSYLSAENRIKIYFSDGLLKKDIVVKDAFASNKKETIQEDDTFLYRTTAWASNKYIYFLGLYDSNEKIYYENPDSTFRTSFEVWDWDGNPILRSSFDRFIINFTVSEKLGKIYGFSPTSTNKIFEYDLPSQIILNN